MEVIEDPALRPRNVTMTPEEKDAARNSNQFFMEPEERREVIRQYGRDHGLKVLIETGTSRGDTPWTLRGDFDSIWTIELFEPLYLDAVERFRRYPSIHPLRGDSTDILPRILREVLDGPALFWLDGHYSGPGTGHGVESTPIREELEIILNDRFKHVVLIDDARCFYGGAENPYDGEPLWDHYGTYPSLKWVETKAVEHGYSYELKDDIIRLVPDD